MLTAICRALLEVVKGLGSRFAPLLDSALLDLIFSALPHSNRFVRESGYYLCAELVQVLTEDCIGDTSVVSWCISRCIP